MYRQILVEPSQRSLKRILWRSVSNDNLKTYELNTVTYEHASASYLAIRCLFQLASECEESSPAIAEVIRRDFYVDDLLTGSDSFEQTQEICRQVSNELKKGCFELRKWHSNKPEILENIDDSDISQGILKFGPEENSKLLGLTWSWKDDKLVYDIDSSCAQGKCTKRNVLSFIARIFDPLGLLSPCTIIAKMFTQQLWFNKLSWDDVLPLSLAKDWCACIG